MEAQKDPNDKRYEPLKGAVQNVLVLPHHAALNTACNGMVIKETQTLNSQLSTLTRIANLIRPSCVYASAHFMAHVWHPCKDVIQAFNTVMANAPIHKVLTVECCQDDQGYPNKQENKVLRNLICEDETRHIYTSHAYVQKFIVKEFSDEKKLRSIMRQVKYQHSCCELICQMGSNVQNLISYRMETV